MNGYVQYSLAKKGGILGDSQARGFLFVLTVKTIILEEGYDDG